MAQARPGLCLAQALRALTTACILLSAASTQASSLNYPCQNKEGKYCSCSATKGDHNQHHYLGALDHAHEVKEALALAAHNKEVRAPMRLCCIIYIYNDACIKLILLTY